MITDAKKGSEWFRRYDLVEARLQGCKRDPAPHQSRSLKEMMRVSQPQNSDAV